MGPTGAGKTSIANLIGRLYDVRAGAVRIDGIAVRDVTQRARRRQMGLVSQAPFLFAGTIADNSAFGQPGTPLSAIEQAARMANAHRRRSGCWISFAAVCSIGSNLIQAMRHTPQAML